jgi:cysteate synthase
MESMHYRLHCLACGEPRPEYRSGFRLQCDCAAPPQGLLRAEYAARFVPGSEGGVFRYRAWLPIRRSAAPAAAHRQAAPGPVAYRSRELARRIGLDELVVLFSGYWPERGAHLETCVFKELEALAVTARLPAAERRPLVVASAGNTGRAFHAVCSRYDIPAVVVVPEAALPALWTTGAVSPEVALVAVGGNADYADAIRVAGMLAESPAYLAEGGALNVARRDGMGSVLLAGVECAGRLPRHYFQAVGSGTGAIAAWEMAQRLVRDGRFGARVPRLQLAQNAPFTIMADAWEAGSRSLLPLAPATAKRRIAAMSAGVLSNRTPPYALAGGLFDALTASAGAMYRVSNREAAGAAALFAASEGCELDPAAAVAVAALRQAVAGGRVAPDDPVFLNVTGGGLQRLRAAGRVRALPPDLVVDHRDATPAALEAALVRAPAQRERAIA